MSGVEKVEGVEKVGGLKRRKWTDLNKLVKLYQTCGIFKNSNPASSHHTLGMASVDPSFYYSPLRLFPPSPSSLPPFPPPPPPLSQFKMLCLQKPQKSRAKVLVFEFSSNRE